MDKKSTLYNTVINLYFVSNFNKILNNFSHNYNLHYIKYIDINHEVF